MRTHPPRHPDVTALPSKVHGCRWGRMGKGVFLHPCVPAVTKSPQTFCDLTDCSLPGSSVPENFQARIWGWVAISSSKGSFPPRDQIHASCISYIGREGSLPLSRLRSNLHHHFRSVQFSSVALCDPMNRIRPGLPVHHQLPEFTQTHVHPVSDAIQPSHPLSSPNPSQHQSLIQ